MKPFCSKSVRTCTEALAHYKKAISAHEEIFGDQLNDFDKAVYTRKFGEIYFQTGRT